MCNLLAKEFRLSAHILSYLFIIFGLMALIPGYPITLGELQLCALRILKIIVKCEAQRRGV